MKHRLDMKNFILQSVVLVCIALPFITHANDTSDVTYQYDELATTNPPSISDEIKRTQTEHHAQAQEQSDWIDKQRTNTKDWLNRVAHRMDGWFGEPETDKPARASLRVMIDMYHNQYDGTSVKPRVRAKVRLPTLENRLSILIGDDELDYEHGGGIYTDSRVATISDTTFDSRQARRDNSSLALRFSRLSNDIQDELGVNLDADIGLRSNDIYLRLRGEKTWQMTHKVHGRFEQMYRYGSKSEHFALTTLEFTQPQSQIRSLVNRAYLAYSHNDDIEKVDWSNSLYQQHLWRAKHGQKTFSYGLYAGGHVHDKSPRLDTYGPYISYRQPVWREWLFMQTDISYYNDKAKDRDHHLGLFGRMEIVF